MAPGMKGARPAARSAASPVAAAAAARPRAAPAPAPAPRLEEPRRPRPAEEPGALPGRAEGAVGRHFAGAQARAEISFRRDLNASAADDECTVSLHPDALRRRFEAVLRREARRAGRSLAAEARWWELVELPNFHVVDGGVHALKRLVKRARRADRPVICQVFTAACNPCRRLHLKHMALCAENEGYDFAMIDAADCAGWCDSVGVTTVPHFLLLEADLTPRASAGKMEELGVPLRCPNSVMNLDPYRWSSSTSPEHLAGPEYVALHAIICSR